MNAVKALLLTFLFIISGMAGFCAENDDAAVLIAEKLKYSTEQTEQFWAVSKIWPADKSITIAALMFPNVQEGDDAVYNIENNDFLAVNQFKIIENRENLKVCFALIGEFSAYGR